MAFITSLTIKNFFSIKDEVTIDFKASPYNIENNPERLFEFDGKYYNKIISFYGANASGKTTILKAITVLASIVVNEQRDNFPPSFKNKFARLNSNSELEISFVLKNKEYEEYTYFIKFESSKYNNIGIKNEILYKTENSKRKMIFNRVDKKVTNVDKNIQDNIFTNLNPKKSLIQEFLKHEKTGSFKNINYFFVFILRSSNITLYKTQLSTNISHEKTIGDFIYSKESKVEQFFLNFFQSIEQDIIKVKANFIEKDDEEKEFKGIELFHKIKKNEPLAFDFESDGTQMIMKILLDIYIAKATNSILIIDEFDSILHPMLVPIIINLLIKNDIQIIYSTHNIYNMQFLQNDEIFLIEKDEKHTTTIKPVKNNPNIKGYKNLLTLYENGDLGGVPNIKEIITKIL